MKTKNVFFSELAYVFGIITLALGTALMERADFGMSMVVAPAYLLHLKLSQYYPAFTFGISEYLFQAFLLITLSVAMRRFKKSYLFSFITAVIYGSVLDLMLRAVRYMPQGGVLWRSAYFAAGMLLCALGVSFFFHTYIAPEAYELFVKEIAKKYKRNVNRVKTAYDCCSCLTGILLSFAFFGFGHFEGVKLGTVFCALFNGWLIGHISSIMESLFLFKDAFPLRDIFNQ